MITNMLIIRDCFATLTQRIKISQISKIDLKNKFQNNRDLSFEFRLKSTK